MSETHKENSDQQSPADSADAAGKSQASHTFDLAMQFQILQCPQCDVHFALPLALYFKRMHDSSKVFCANGHIIRVATNSPWPKGAGAAGRCVAALVSDRAALLTQLVAELAQAKLDAERLREQLNLHLARRDEAQAQIDEGELSRRIRYCVNRAARTDSGKFICRICESLHAGTGLKSHLERAHKQELANLPAEYFAA